MTVNIFIIENDKTVKWEDLSPEDKKRVSEQLNYQALTSVGYAPKRKQVAV